MGAEASFTGHAGSCRWQHGVLLGGHTAEEPTTTRVSHPRRVHPTTTEVDESPTANGKLHHMRWFATPSAVASP